LNGVSERDFDKAVFTAEARRTQSLLFDLFSFERKENNNNMPCGDKNVIHERILMYAATIFTAITL